MHNYNGIYIIDTFLTTEQAEKISTQIKPLLQQSPNPLVYCALGFPTQQVARMTNIDRPVIPKTGDVAIDELSTDLTSIVLRIKNLLSEVYNKELYLIQLTYNQMKEGGSNQIHIDDATGMYDHLEYAALLYTTSQGTDYTGGEIYFPAQELVLSPAKGTLIFFKGDEDKPHGVQEVSYGYRENIIMFFSSRADDTTTDD